MSDDPLHSKELVTAALHELARLSPQSASPESRAALAQAFRRHHSRRRAVRVAAMFAVILAVASSAFWLRTVLREASTTRPERPAVIATQVAAGREVFVALPSFALETPGEDLRVIRVEMPVSSLRVLGARVNDELSTRRIVADLLVGTDGTPYAFRIIS